MQEEVEEEVILVLHQDLEVQVEPVVVEQELDKVEEQELRELLTQEAVEEVDRDQEQAEPAVQESLS